MMFCSKCNHDLNECVCADIDTRLRELSDKGSHMMFKWCLTCDKHYARCRCEEPIFGIRTDGRTSVTTMDFRKTGDKP